jgi:hypothetical protein
MYVLKDHEGDLRVEAQEVTSTGNHEQHLSAGY